MKRKYIVKKEAQDVEVNNSECEELIHKMWKRKPIVRRIQNLVETIPVRMKMRRN